MQANNPDGSAFPVRYSIIGGNSKGDWAINAINGTITAVKVIYYGDTDNSDGK